MLALDALHAHYGLSHVLQGVSLALGKGEVLGVFGRNGVGKTTLVKAVAGWVKPSSGSIRFDGADFAGSEQSTDMYASIDNLISNITRQLSKHKEKITNHHKA